MLVSLTALVADLVLIGAVVVMADTFSSQVGRKREVVENSSLVLVSAVASNCACNSSNQNAEVYDVRNACALLDRSQKLFAVAMLRLNYWNYVFSDQFLATVVK